MSVQLELDVAAIVSAIPRGRVMTYGDIGHVIGAHPRQVGRVMSRLTGTPFHRVVRSDGTPPSCHDGTAALMLRSEDTPMNGMRVDMGVARWVIPTLDEPLTTVDDDCTIIGPPCTDDPRPPGWKR